MLAMLSDGENERQSCVSCARQGTGRNPPAWSALLASGTAVLALAVIGCGGRLPLAPEAPSAPLEWIQVGSPPPPALPEEIAYPEEEDERATDDLVWTDGCWEWSVGRWVWMRGGWVKSPQDATYFHGKLGIAPDGRLFWAPCTWVREGKALGYLAPRLPALYPPTARTVQR